MAGSFADLLREETEQRLRKRLNAAVVVQRAYRLRKNKVFIACHCPEFRKRIHTQGIE
jgi:hypothetical protein